MKHMASSITQLRIGSCSQTLAWLQHLQQLRVLAHEPQGAYTSQGMGSVTCQPAHYGKNCNHSCKHQCE